MSGPESLEMRRNRLIDRLVRAGYVLSPEVERAMRTVPREKFVPEEIEADAYIDSPMPIGHQQTISAPHMVAIMVEEMELQANMKVLEIGGGSGYHAAVVAELVKPGGRVFSIERIPELVAFARRNIERAGYSALVTVIQGDGSRGLPEEAPFDRIFVACAAPDVPKPLVDQLAEGGVLLVPVGGGYHQTLMKAKKQGGKMVRESRGLCTFVPLIGEHGFR